jgi:hypothetical protein
MEVLDKMKVVVRSFTYNMYGLAFNYTVTLDNSHIVERAARVQGLVKNDVFLNGQLSVRIAGLPLTHEPLVLTSFEVGGVNINVAFANPAILAMVSYFLRDSEYQYHRYIEGHNIKPLLAMTATFGRWALQECRTGRYIASAFLPEVNHSQYNRYVSLLESLSPSQLATLTSLLFTNSSAL